MTEPVIEIIKPDVDGFLPNGWVDTYPHNDGFHPCTLQCCEPEAYPTPTAWGCQKDGCWARLRKPGECINCSPKHPAS